MRLNISDLFFEQAKANKNKTAVSLPKKGFFGISHQEQSFSELLSKVWTYEKNFFELGIKKNTKVLVFVRPGFEFPAVTFSLFSIGAVPIFIDPGMGKDNLLKAIETVKPEVMIAENEVHILRFFYKKSFSSIKTAITVGGLRLPNLHRTRDFEKSSSVDQNIRAITKEHSLAAILFTSGGTGSPKGVEYTHEIFWNQTKTLKKMFGLTASDVDVPGFPLFGLFTLAMGMTIVPPLMNPSRPAKANPKLLVQNIIDNKATFVAGSPAIWEKVADYCLSKKIKLPTVKFLVMFGAPVAMTIHEKFQRVLEAGDTYTPYGATECLPISLINGRQILNQLAKKFLRGEGTCVGQCVDGVQLKAIQITDSPLSWEEIEWKAPGEIGELLVTTKTVTKRYFSREKETNLAKIVDPEGQVWHRMGDIGYLDKNNHIWFCGRKSHRVISENKMLTPIQCEAIFNNHNDVKRSALVGLRQGPAIVVESNDATKKKNKIEKELIKMASLFEHTKNIRKVYFTKKFPVDVRHNIKIDRLKLRDMFNQDNQ